MCVRALSSSIQHHLWKVLNENLTSTPFKQTLEMYSSCAVLVLVLEASLPCYCCRVASTKRFNRAILILWLGFFRLHSVDSFASFLYCFPYHLHHLITDNTIFFFFFLFFPIWFVFRCAIFVLLPRLNGIFQSPECLYLCMHAVCAHVIYEHGQCSWVGFVSWHFLKICEDNSVGSFTLTYL